MEKLIEKKLAVNRRLILITAILILALGTVLHTAVKDLSPHDIVLVGNNMGGHGHGL